MLPAYSSSRSSKCRGIAALVLLVAASSTVRAQVGGDVSDEHPKKVNSRIQSAEVDGWLDALGSESYASRMAAMESLVSAGPATIDAIVTALGQTDDTETQLRALEVLERLANREIASQQSPAAKALKELRNSDTPVLANRAASRLARVANRRRQYAISYLSQLGAHVQESAWPIRQFARRPTVARSVELDSQQWRGTSEDAQLLADLDDVATVKLTGPQISDDYLKPLGQLEGLSILLLKRTAVTDEGIEYLASCPELAELQVFYTEITDAAVESLSRLPLHSLELTGTQITSAAVETLRKQMPGVKIEYKAGAYLGVGADVFGDSEAKGCRLTKVEDKSAAQQAGMMKDDIIMRYNGDEVSDFESLRKLIGQNRAGDRVIIEWERDGKPFKAEVELGAWDPR